MWNKRTLGPVRYLCSADDQHRQDIDEVLVTAAAESDRLKAYAKQTFRTSGFWSQNDPILTLATVWQALTQATIER
jgi:hypothetical protein